MSVNKNRVEATVDKTYGGGSHPSVEPIVYVYYDKVMDGLGIKAGEPIRAGSFIRIYAGVQVHFEDIKDLHAQKSANYIMVRTDPRTGKKFCVNSKNCGNEARFLNHYCGEPNTVINFEVSNLDPAHPNLIVYAAKNIQKDEALVVQYVPHQTPMCDKYWYGIEDCRCSYSGPDGHIFTKAEAPHPAFRN